MQQQIGYKPDILIASSSIGFPDIDALYSKFEKYLNIELVKYSIDDINFRKRGLLRNQQLKYAIDNKYKYIYLADCDIVYPDIFFESLYQKREQIKKCSYYLPKLHTDVASTEDFINDFYNNTKVDKERDIYRKCSKIKTIDKKNKRVAAGNMQVCSVQEIINKNGGIYVEPNKTRDNDMIEKGQKARSDIQFRRSIGGSNHIELNCAHPIHLNHSRDKEAGRHLEEKR
jgi:hypothetical protein